MKILLVHNKYKSRNVSGEDVVFLNEYKALSEQLGNKNVYKYCVSNDSANNLRIFFSIFFSFKHYNSIYKIVKNDKIDLVHIHNFFPLLTPSIFLAAKNAGAKVVLTVHNYRIWCISGILFRDSHGICEDCIKKNFLSGVVHRCYKQSFFLSLFLTIVFKYYQLINIYKSIDKYFVLTEFQRSKLLEYNVDYNAIAIKPNFVNASTYDSQHKTKSYIFVGRLEESKGLQILFKIWPLLSLEYELIIVGDGILKQKTETYSARHTNIKYLGKLPHSQTLTLIAQSKYLLFPSLVYETFGLSILEAMIVGTPVIGLDIGTRKEFIRNEYNGFLTTKTELKRIIEYSYTYTKYPQLEENCKRFANNFSKKVILNKQITLYKKIINKNF